MPWASIVMLCSGRGTTKEHSVADLTWSQQAAFTEDECATLRAEFVKGQSREGGDLGTMRQSTYVGLEEKRHSWARERIIKYARQANDAKWKYELFALALEREPMQLAVYDGTQTGQYAMHTDSLPRQDRLLSISVQLSDGDAYEEGDLQVGAENATREAGALIIFPSWLMHQVYPVRQGKRFSLVTFIHGADAPSNHGPFWRDARQTWTAILNPLSTASKELKAKGLKVNRANLGEYFGRSTLDLMAIASQKLGLYYRIIDDRMEKATGHFGRSLQLSEPGTSTRFSSLHANSMVASEQGNLKKAARVLEEALSIYPSHEHTQKMFQHALRTCGRDCEKGLNNEL